MKLFYAKEPNRSWAKHFWYRLARRSCFIYCKIFYRFKVTGQDNIPKQGGIVFATNHQSFIDPILVGGACKSRHPYKLARASLWNNKILGPLISSLNAIPVARDQADTQAVRQCISILKEGSALLVFPEGTRTTDATVGPFKPGTMLMIKRSKATVVPVSISGAFEIWPRKQKLPKLFGKVALHYGKPIPPEELIPMGAEKSMTFIRDIIEAKRIEMAEKLNHNTHTHSTTPQKTDQNKQNV